MGWALDGGEDIGGALADMDYEDLCMEEIERERDKRERNLVGKYLIVCNAPSNGRLLYLQNREISKRGFWTKFKSNAFGFSNKEWAEQLCKKLKYNSPRVIICK